jgi:hypothetical protein
MLPGPELLSLAELGQAEMALQEAAREYVRSVGEEAASSLARAAVVYTKAAEACRDAWKKVPSPLAGVLDEP